MPIDFISHSVRQFFAEETLPGNFFNNRGEGNVLTFDTQDLVAILEVYRASAHSGKFKQGPFDAVEIGFLAQICPEDE